MKKKTLLGIIAAALIFFGFGMIHGTPTTSTIGSIFIGIGCLYLIFVLYKSLKQSK